jgi:IclR family transcriptional regulator, acetate operon repressor
MNAERGDDKRRAGSASSVSDSAAPEPQHENAYSIRAVQRVCDILDMLREAENGASLREVAAVTGLPVSSTFRYLATLEERGHVERLGETGRYRMGVAFLPLQARQLDLLAARSRPHLELLRDEFGETVNLGLLQGTRIHYLEIVESPKAMRLAARQGDRDPIHCTALGKAIAAQLPENRVRAILAAEGMTKMTDRTITSVAVYFEELEAVRHRGYALDNGENEDDGRCIAVYLAGSGLPAAISLSAPTSRFPLDRVESIADALRGVSTRLGADLSS